jgi:hypothetical protein
MSRRRLLTDEQAEELYREYQEWLARDPNKLAAKYGISRDRVLAYGKRKLKSLRRRAA